MKIKIIRDSIGASVEESVNAFIADKNVIDIKYTTIACASQYYNGVPSKIAIYDTAMVMYEE